MIALYTLWFIRVGVMDSAHVSQIAVAKSNIEKGVYAMESGQRGYLYTEDPAYLDSYSTGHRLVDIYIGSLKIMVRQPQSKELSEQVAIFLALKEQEMDQSIRVHDQHGSEAAKRIVESDIGRTYTKQILHVLDQILDQEKTRNWSFFATLLGMLPLFGIRSSFPYGRL